MIEIAALTALLLAIFAVVTLAGALLKLVLWAVLLPLKFLLGVLLIPLLLLKAAAAGLALLIVAPLVVVLLIALAIVTAAAVVLPLLPILCVGLLVWVIARATTRPVAAS